MGAHFWPASVCSIVILKFARVAVYINNFFLLLLLSSILPCGYTAICLLHSPVDGRLGCSQDGASLQSFSEYVYTSVCGHSLQSLLCEHPGLERLDHPACVRVRNCQIFLKRPHCCAPPKGCERPGSVFFAGVLLLDAQCCLTVVLIGVSLMTDEVEHLFLCLAVISLSSLVKCLFKSLACFEIVVLGRV